MRTALSAARIFLFPHHNKDCWAAFDKIGCASEKKIEQALFFPLGLHYLSILKSATIIQYTIKGRFMSR